MSTARHLSLEQFAANAADLLESVRAQGTPIVVDFASGESLLITLLPPSQAAGERAAGGRAADKRTPQEQPSQQPPAQELELDTGNISSVGAMYDIDPNSVTPG
ncbi:MAG: hypothetical protein DCC57_12695 [Chloroflexi bacterium]|nr:MAG: hypothetical protein DCC57_12695 [Chloroflexota bacterium]